MLLTMLIIITALGLMVPLAWFIGTTIGITYFCLREVHRTGKGRTAAIYPQLGLTMADGGDPVDRKE